MPAALRILVTGNFDREEFATAVAEMREGGELIQVGSLESAAEWLAGNPAVGLAVVAQARPGQFSAAAIERLPAAAPLTPIVALLGSWCEGEMRSGSPWPGVPRVYWHQWPARFAQEAPRLARRNVSAWSEPATATAEERLLGLARRRLADLNGIGVVISSNCETGDCLRAACLQFGLSTISMRRPPIGITNGIDFVLCDVGLVRESADNVRSASIAFPEAVVVALADFPRTDDMERLRNAGAAAVLAKPLDIADLRAAISRFLPAAT